MTSPPNPRLKSSGVPSYIAVVRHGGDLSLCPLNSPAPPSPSVKPIQSPSRLVRDNVREDGDEDGGEEGGGAGLRARCWMGAEGVSVSGRRLWMPDPYKPRVGAARALPCRVDSAGLACGARDQLKALIHPRVHLRMPLVWPDLPIGTVPAESFTDYFNARINKLEGPSRISKSKAENGMRTRIWCWCS